MYHPTVRELQVMTLAVLLAIAGCGPLDKPPPVKPEPPKKVAPVVEISERALPELQVRQARSKFTLEVLGLELVGTIDPAAQKASRTLTTWMRVQAKEDRLITLGTKNTDLIDARLIAGCNDVELACMTTIARSVNADRILYGIVNDLHGEYYVNLTLLDTVSGTQATWSGTCLATERELAYTAKSAFYSLISQLP